jgi:hypothetical protein
MKYTNKKQVTNRTTSVSERGTKHRSMLQTETRQLTLEEFFSKKSLTAHNEGYDIDVLMENLRQRALGFLDFKQIPYSELRHGVKGITTKEWRAQYDHIPGVTDALGLLLELHCFSQDRENKPDLAYAHLLRAALGIQSIVIAEMEAQFFVGKSRQGDGGNWNEREIRKEELLSEYCKLRLEGKSEVEARRLAAKRIKVSLTTAKRYFTLEEIEMEYQLLEGQKLP